MSSLPAGSFDKPLGGPDVPLRGRARAGPPIARHALTRQLPARAQAGGCRGERWLPRGPLSLITCGTPQLSRPPSSALGVSTLQTTPLPVLHPLVFSI